MCNHKADKPLLESNSHFPLLYSATAAVISAAAAAASHKGRQDDPDINKNNINVDIQDGDEGGGAGVISEEIKCLVRIAHPIVATAVIVYFRSVISMLFLGRLGEVELAGGAAAQAFANITGYSVLSGLALGMEPLCSQAFGAHQPKLLSLTLHRTIIFLLAVSVPISVLWLNVQNILVLIRQDPTIAHIAGTYLIWSLPELVTNCFLHPVRNYLRAQGITYPLTLASLAGAVVHLPVCLLLVSGLGCGVAGVAASAAASNFFAALVLVAYVWARGLHQPTWMAPSRECLTGWAPLVKLSVPSCISVCLEWWWYEIMILLCGLLAYPQTTVASMGILIQTTSLIYIFPSSLGFAVSTRVGNELGANRPARAKLSANVSIAIAALMGVSAMAFATGTRNLWGRAFSGDRDVVALTSAALPILGLCELGNSPQTVGCGVLRGMARPSTAARVNLGAFYLLGMPVAVSLGLWLGFGFLGLWLGLLTAQLSCAGLMLYAVRATDWDAQAERAQSLTSSGNPVSLLHGAAVVGDEKEPLLRVFVQ